MANHWKSLASKVEEALELNRIQGSPKELYQPIDYTLSLGGKRIRPTLALMAAELFGKEAQEAMIVALAIEIFHNFTLVHDDIMDEAPLRRGEQTVHKKWGRDIAILSGDVMFVKAYQQLCKVNSPNLIDLLQLFNQTAIEVCEGQQLDMNFESSSSIGLQDYIRMIELKTAVLLAASLKMGSIVAEAPEKDADLIYEFGRNLGIAFQIQDDYLDAFADPEKFGKRVGGDILSNKKTYLLLSAMQLSSSKQKDALETSMQSLKGDSKVEKVKQLFEEVGAVEQTQKAIKDYSNRAMKALEQIDCDTAAKKPMKELSDYLMQRGV
jgi:geranylgeranyl diphosphate synthase type II